MKVLKKKRLSTIFVLSLFVVLVFSVYVILVAAKGTLTSFNVVSYHQVVRKTEINGTGTEGYFGSSVASGDVNNDNYSDVIISAYSDYNPDGHVYVFFGTANGISDTDLTNANITLNGTGSTATDYFGSSVTTGDVNNDSYADIIAGAYLADPYDSAGNQLTDAGQVYVFFGADFGTTRINENVASYANISVNGTIAADYFGYSVASGDVNNDTYADIIVGAYTADSTLPNGSIGINNGQAYVFFGDSYPDTSSGISYNALIDANITFNGTVNSDSFSNAFGTGDVNNDSYVDIIAGAYAADPSDASGAGQAYVFFGGDYSNAAPGAVSYNVLIDANITVNGTIAGDQLGYSVSVSDINNDGYSDILVGAYTADPYDSTGNQLVNAGQVYVFFGGDYSNAAPGAVSYNALIDANITVNGTIAGDRLGNSVGGGDINGNSYSDIIIGAYCADPPTGTSDGGQAYVFFGGDYSNAAPGAVSYNALIDANITVNGTANSFGYLGYSVSSGDVNNNSYADLIVGVQRTDPLSVIDAGQVYIYVYDNVIPIVTLDSPADNSYDTDSDINFRFTTSEENPDTCNLYFRSNATNWEWNDSIVYFNNIQANIFVNLTDAVYIWNIECNDTANNTATFSSSNYTFTVDTVAPVTPTLTAPTDTSINPRDSISYTCDSSDATAGISKWTWTLTKPQSGGTVTKTGGAITSNTQTFSGDDTNLAGTYTVACEVEDKAGHKSSTSSSFAVYYSHGSGDGGGGPGVGVSPSAAVQLDFTVQNELQIKEPQGAVMTFTLDGTAVHTIKLTEVTTNKVTVVIEPKNVKVTLDIGEIKEADADGDGINDISVSLESIENGVAQIVTKKIQPPVQEEPAEVVSKEVPEETIPEEVPKSKAWLWVLTISIIIVIGFGYWFIQKKR